MASLSRKDYRAIVKIIYDETDGEGMIVAEDLARAMASWCAENHKSNLPFDRALFIHACREGL